MPGYGHEGLHPDMDGPCPPIGSWGGVSFIIVLSPYGGNMGTKRVVPGSHREAPRHNGERAWAMPPHADEVRIEAEPGDVIIHSSHVWKSETFNGGLAPRKCLWV